MEKGSDAAKILAGAGVTPQSLTRRSKSFARAGRPTGQRGERLRSAEEYARDLTEAARAGKLDPVIGRDEEIRRTIQVLSRRTKNNPVLIGEPGVGRRPSSKDLAKPDRQTATCPSPFRTRNCWRSTWAR